MPDEADDFLRKWGGAKPTAPVAEPDEAEAFLSKWGGEAPAPVAASDPFANDKNPERNTPTTPEQPGLYAETFGSAVDARLTADREDAEVAKRADRASHGYLRRVTLDAAGDAAKVVGSGALKATVAFNEGLNDASRSAQNLLLNAIDRVPHRNPFESRADVPRDPMVTRARETVDRAHANVAARSPNFKAISEHTDKVAEMGGSIASAMVAGPKRFALMEGLKHPDDPVRAAAEAELFMRFQGALAKTMAGVDPSKVRQAAATGVSTVIAGVASGQSVEEAIGAGLAFVAHGAVHKAPPRMGVNNPGATASERGYAPPSREATAKAITEAVETGRVDPREAFSPERVEVVKEAVAEGRDPVAALEARPETVRPDGSVEGPAGQPSATAKIDPVVKPLVDDMRARGITTVSSDRGLDGAGVVIGIDPAGSTVVERGPPAEAARPAPKPQSDASIEREAGKYKSLTQHVREQGGFDYQREYHKGELDMLRQKDSATSGLVKTKAKGGKTAEELMQSAREAGFDIPEDMTAAEFIQRVGENRLNDRSTEAGDIDSRMADVEYRRAMQAAEQQRADMEAMVPKIDPTSIANEPIRQSREGRGLPLIEKGPKRPWKQVVEEARSALDAEPKLADHLLREIDSGKRIPSDTDVAVLTIHRMNLREQVAVNDARGEHAAKYGDVEGAAMAKDRAVELESDLAKTDFLYDLAGGDAGRALAARKMEMAQDYSVEAIKTKMRRQKNYEPLNEKDVAEATDLAKRYEDAVKARDEFKARAEKAEADLAFGEHPASRKAPAAKGDKAYGAKNKIVTREAYEATKAELKAALGSTNLGAMKFLDPTILAKVVKAGVFHVEATGHKFAEWAKAMLDDHGPAIEPYLKDAYDAATKQVRDVTLEGISAKAKEGFAEGKKLDQMPGTVKDLAELVINSGVHGREPVTDAVHEIVKSLDPSITRDAVREALTGYGKVRKLDMDPAKVELREITAETLELLKLRDMEAGQAPKATGNQRQPPSDAKRELTKKVNEAKKKYGYDVTDPATQLKTANDAVETRWRNEIADMDRQIAAGKKDIPVKSDLVLTESAKAMKAARDKKKAEYEAVFGKPGLTDAQRADRAVAVVERSIKELQRKVAAGDVFPAKKATGPTSPELEALRAQRDELRQVAADMRDAANPKLSENDKVIRRLQRQLAKLKEQVATGDVMPKERVVKPRSPEAIRLEAEVLMAKKAVNEAIFQRHLAARTGIQRAGAAALEVTSTARALMTSFDVSAVLRQGGIVAMSHPVRAFKALGEMFRAFKSPEATARAEAELTMRPTYSLAKRSGLFLAEHGDVRLAKMEENYQSRWAQHIPGVAGSQRAYTTFLNRIRMDSFDAMIRNLSKGATPTKAEAEAVAQYVNVATGRGGWKGEKVLTALNQAFFSPRLVASRFQYLAGQPMYGGSARTRLLIAGEYARFLTGAATVLGLGLLAGAKVEDDSRSSDFGKMRWGNTRLDPWAGLQQVTVLEERIRRGKVRGIDGSLRKTDLGTITNFGRSKLAPGPGAAVSSYLGRDPTGEKTSLWKETLGLVTPMSVGGKAVWFDGGDVYAAMKEQGVPSGTALWILNLFGMSMANYKKRRR